MNFQGLLFTNKWIKQSNIHQLLLVMHSFSLCLLTFPHGVLRYDVTDNKCTNCRALSCSSRLTVLFIYSCLRIRSFDECILFELLLHWICTDVCVKHIEIFYIWLIRTLHKLNETVSYDTWQFFQRMPSSNKYKCIKLKFGLKIKKWQLNSEIFPLL